ncbi:hypothetical protein HYPSUDRAFT_205318 [Hypholoma sublateritium FD-334 SS-4]|uniref:Uncharacterized protein n=1 Tax=Hypholoma sublateritium (strain FD-334 SS-4) TaxID=945553 RepID=A0A0D2PE63_HYPSF|nr:hypothetical protein HYPSUDRAFT_205318 [Hypholoma sublateritium FD-334 SS-4]
MSMDPLSHLWNPPHRRLPQNGSSRRNALPMRPLVLASAQILHHSLTTDHAAVARRLTDERENVPSGSCMGSRSVLPFLTDGARHPGLGYGAEPPLRVFDFGPHGQLRSEFLGVVVPVGVLTGDRAHCAFVVPHPPTTTFPLPASRSASIDIPSHILAPTIPVRPSATISSVPSSASLPPSVAPPPFPASYLNPPPRHRSPPHVPCRSSPVCSIVAHAPGCGALCGVMGVGDGYGHWNANRARASPLLSRRIYAPTPV